MPIPPHLLREALEEAYSDLYKERFGCRPMCQWHLISTETLGEWIVQMQADADARVEYDRMESEHAAREAAREAAAANEWMDRAAALNAPGWW